MYSIFKTARSGNVKFFSAGDYLFDTYDTCANAAKGYAERFPSIGEGDYKPAYACVESKTKLEIKAEPYANITFKNERDVPLVLDDEGNPTSDIIGGYMPVGRHYGFIYNEYTNARTIAHELAHGTNALHHTFSPESETFYTMSKTDNLMDYNEGEYLNHRQWQWSHEKHRNVLGFLDDEGEGEMRMIDGKLTEKKLRDICLSYKNRENVGPIDQFVVPNKESRITVSKANEYEFIYFYENKEKATKYLHDNNQLNDNVYALCVIEDVKGTTDKIDVVLSDNKKTCPNVFDEEDDEDFILELIRKIKLANNHGEDLVLSFENTSKHVNGITLPNRSVISDVQVVVNTNRVSLKEVKVEYEMDMGYADSVFYFGKPDEEGFYPMQISCNAEDASKLRTYWDINVVGAIILPTDRYIVSDAQAVIRDENGNSLEGKPIIRQGTEVKIVPNVNTTDGAYIQVEVVGSNPKQLLYTAASNLTKIEVLEKPEKKEIKRTVKSVRLPFANEESREIKESEEYYVVAKCGSYLRISNTENVSWETSEGYWVKRKYLSYFPTKGDIFLDFVPWISQFDSILFSCQTCWSTKACCNRACNKILSMVGTFTSNAMKVVIAKGNSDCGNIECLSKEYLDKAILILDKSLYEHNLPILVGVHHPKFDKKSNSYFDKCSGNTPQITNHYVVVVGKKYDISRKQWYYLFLKLEQNIGQKVTVKKIDCI